MKTRWLLAAGILVASHAQAQLTPVAPALPLHDNWQWPAQAHAWTLGVLPGVATINDSTGFSLQFAAAYKMLDKGFAPDISNQVFLEVQGGPFTTSRGSAFLYSAHLRWDFRLDGDWTFYGLGGLGGNKTSAALGGDFQLLPRFGAGAILSLDRQTQLPLDLRGEISRELVAFGLQFRL
jgi:hypothetical protein